MTGTGTQAWSVGGGGTLGGNATIGGLYVANGVVAPGTSIGTLNVTGNIDFTGGVYRVEVNATRQSDLIAATGRANIVDRSALAGGPVVQVLAANGGAYAPKSNYTILTATNGVIGTFAGVSSDLSFLIPSLSYTTDSVILTLTRAALLGSAARTPNQAATASGLDHLAFDDPLYLKLLNLSAPGAQQAFDALSGEVHATVQGTLLDASRYMRGAVLGRLRSAPYATAADDTAALAFGGPVLAYQPQGASALPVKAPPLAPSAPGPDLTFWAQGFGAWGRFDGDGNAAPANRSLGGFFSGVDQRVAETWRVGVATGYSRSDVHVDARASSAGVDSYHVAAYAGTAVGGFNTRWGAAYAWHEIATNRSIVFPGFVDQASARYNGGTVQGVGEVGYAVPVGRGAFEPFAGLAWVHQYTEGFTETGGAGALTGAATTQTVGYSTLGLRAATSFALENGMVLVPRATLAWQHAFGDVTPTSPLAFQGGAAPFVIAGVPLARDSALVEAGLDVRLTPRATLGVSYIGQLASGAQDHAGKGKFAYNF